MSSFDVTETPSKIYLGDQPVVSLVNDGAYSIYLDSNSSVSPFNGIELPPTGQMTWNPQVELFACTRKLQEGQEFRSRLRTTPSGNLQVTTRAKFFKELYNGSWPNQSTGATGYIECGHCATILVKTPVNSPGFVQVQVFNALWYDADLNLILTEPCRFTMGFTDQPTDGAWKARIPVKGRYVRLQWQGLTGNYSSPAKVTVVGSDLPAPFYADGGYNVTGVTSYTTFVPGISCVLPAAATMDIYLPSYGNNISITFAGGITTAGQLFVVLATTGQTLVGMNLGVSGGTIVSTDVKATSRVPLRLIMSAVPTAASTVVAVYSDYE